MRFGGAASPCLSTIRDTAIKRLQQASAGARARAFEGEGEEEEEVIAGGVSLAGKFSAVADSSYEQQQQQGGPASASSAPAASVVILSPIRLTRKNLVEALGSDTVLSPVRRSTRQAGRAQQQQQQQQGKGLAGLQQHTVDEQQLGRLLAETNYAYMPNRALEAGPGPGQGQSRRKQWMDTVKINLRSMYEGRHEAAQLPQPQPEPEPQPQPQHEHEHEAEAEAHPAFVIANSAATAPAPTPTPKRCTRAAAAAQGGAGGPGSTARMPARSSQKGGGGGYGSMVVLEEIHTHGGVKHAPAGVDSFLSPVRRSARNTSKPTPGELILQLGRSSLPFVSNPALLQNGESAA